MATPVKDRLSLDSKWFLSQEKNSSLHTYIQLNVAMPSSDLCEQLMVQNSSGSCDCISQYRSTIKPSVGNCIESEGG